MSRGLNKVFLLGRLGNDPEEITTKGDQTMCRFSLATGEKWTDRNGQLQERTEWHNVIAWGKQALNATQYLHKGSQVYIEGKIQNSNYEDADGVKHYRYNIVVRSMLFLDAGQDDGGVYGRTQGDNGQSQGNRRPQNSNQSYGRQQNNTRQAGNPPEGGLEYGEDERIPF